MGANLRFELLSNSVLSIGCLIGAVFMLRGDGADTNIALVLIMAAILLGSISTLTMSTRSALLAQEVRLASLEHQLRVHDLGNPLAAPKG
jgi:hypothetical protein